ncbi:MAG TPA: 30S ribosomal protein S17 [Firmicutes bacterium]|nr:30S ribosomal protein S17 [Bacillota bacterium]
MTQDSTSRKVRNTRVGVVVSDKMDKTRVIEVERLIRHPLYHRIIRRTVKLKAHDKDNSTHVGDRVKVIETRPLSKEKRWCIIEVLEKAR